MAVTPPARTSNMFTALAAVLLILVAGVAVLYALRAAVPSTTASSTRPPSPTPTQTVAAVTSTAGPSPDPSTVPDQVTISGRSFRIAPASASGSSLWRDFMPIAPPDGRPLMASIRVVAIDGGAFPADITVDRIWLYGPTVWDAAPAEVRRAPDGGTPPSQIEVITRDGPKWEPGIEVDVVLRLRLGAASHFLRLSSVAIDRTS